MSIRAIKGTLIPVGGNEDKGFEEDEIHRLDYIEQGILSHVVREAGGPSAKIVVIPTASSIPVQVGENYLQLMKPPKNETLSNDKVFNYLNKYCY